MSADPLTDDWRDLDRQVAEKVMRWTCAKDAGLGKECGGAFWRSLPDGRVHVWSPTGEIAHAWEVVDRMRAAGWTFDCGLSSDFAIGATASFYRAGCEGDASAGTIQLAICRAALAARDT